MKKKSGAAQRLISLVLALGLIFTLAPASAFAGDEVPASSTVAATTGEEPVVDGTEPVADGTEPVVDGTEPVVDGTEPVVDGTEPVVDGTEPVVDGTEPVVDGTEPVVDGTEPVVDGTEPVVDGTEPAVDGTEPVVDGTEPVVDGTEPVVEEELSSQQTALLAASVPAVMKSGIEDWGQKFIFSSNSSPDVKIWYATKELKGFHYKISELKELPADDKGITFLFGGIENVICFFVSVGENNELDFENSDITYSNNDIKALPFVGVEELEDFEALQRQAMDQYALTASTFLPRISIIR